MFSLSTLSLSTSPPRINFFLDFNPHSLSQFLNEIFSLLLCFLTAIYTSVVFRNRFPSVHDRFPSYQVTAIHHTCSYGSYSGCVNNHRQLSLSLFSKGATWHRFLFFNNFRLILLCFPAIYCYRKHLFSSVEHGVTLLTLFFSDLSFFRDSKNAESLVDFTSITGRVSNNYFTVTVFDRGVIWEELFTLKLSLSRTDASLYLFTVLARFWIFVMFDKSFRISLDFIKEQVRQETQTFDDGADNRDTAMKCESSYPSYSQSEDSAQDFREEIDGQHEYERVVVREDKKLQYDKSTGIASCATIIRKKVPIKRQAPPVLWTKYNDADLWPEDQRIQ